MIKLRSFRPDAPVAIGGVGGSGTRLIAAILLQFDIYMGCDLNEAFDNLWFTLLFNRPEAVDCSDADFEALYTVFRKAMLGIEKHSEAEIRLIQASATASTPHHDSDWLRYRAETLSRSCGGALRDSAGWGWKEPNTHIVLPRLSVLEPEMRYIHVVRNGLDMAYSQNQNQLRSWGMRLFDQDPIAVTPRLSLKYWAAVHHRVLKVGSGMSGRFLMVNCDRLCLDPWGEIPKLMAFVGHDASSANLAAAAALVHPSSGIGRFKLSPRDCFDADDLAFVECMGFDTEWQ